MAKRKDPTADEILKQMFPDIMTSDDLEAEAAAKEEAAKAAAAAPDTARQVTDLQAQLARLEGQLSASQRPGYTPTQSQAPQRPNISYEAAPDPLTDPKGYAQFVHQSTQAQIEYEKQAWAYNNQQQTQAANRTQGLWDQFAEKYKDYASNSDRVEIATTRVIQRAKAAGTDTDKYMYGTSDVFLKDVVGEIEKLWGKPKPAAEDEDDGDEGDTIDNRTQILGGGASGSAPGKVAPQSNQKFGALSQDINAWQQKTGFYR